MHRILLPLFMLPLFLLFAGAAIADDDCVDSASLVGQVAEVFDAVDVSGPSIEGDDGVLSSPYLRHSMPSPLVALRLPLPSDCPALHRADSAPIRAPPAYFV